MNLRDLLVLYALAGVACAVAVWRLEHARGGLAAAWSAALTVPLWPLWAPFVLATPRPRERPTPTSATRDAERARPAKEGASDTRPCRAARARIERALEESVKAVAGTPISQLFSRQIAQRIAEEVARVVERQDELAALTASEGLDRAAAAERLKALEALRAADAQNGAETCGSSARTVATARLQLETLMRLEALREADAQALEELADLLEALRAQLLLARYAGGAADGTGAIVSEVWARLEGLGAGFEPEVRGV